MKLNWATRITIVRILLTAPFVSLMLKINDPTLEAWQQNGIRYIAIIVFLVMAISDGIDGFLARKNGQITRLGTFLDPMADKILITCACLLLASERAKVDGFRMPTTVVVTIIGKDFLLLAGFIVVYLVTAKSYIVPVFAGKAATALQLSMVTGILIAPEVSNVFPHWIWFLRFLWWSAAGMAVAAVLIYIRNGIRFVTEYEQSVSH